MAPHSSTLAWKIPQTEEPGGLQSMRSLRVEVYEAKTSLSLFTFMHWRRKWQPTPVFLPGESQDGGAWWAAVSGVAQSRTRLSDFPFTFHFHALEKDMATCSSIHAWRIPGWGSLVGCHLWGSQSWTRLKQLSSSSSRRLREQINRDE